MSSNATSLGIMDLNGGLLSDLCLFDVEETVTKIN